MRDQIKAFSLPPNEKPGDDNGVEHLHGKDHHTDLKIVSKKQDLKVKVLTWKDSEKGFVKSERILTSERISNFKITNLNNVIVIFIIENRSILVWSKPFGYLLKASIWKILKNNIGRL